MSFHYQISAFVNSVCDSGGQGTNTLFCNSYFKLCITIIIHYLKFSASTEFTAKHLIIPLKGTGKSNSVITQKCRIRKYSKLSEFFSESKNSATKKFIILEKLLENNATLEEHVISFMKFKLQVHSTFFQKFSCRSFGWKICHKIIPFLIIFCNNG